MGKSQKISSLREKNGNKTGDNLFKKLGISCSKVY
jgi:hypothetical protein